jgi:hypothetical protein
MNIAGKIIINTRDISAHPSDFVTAIWLLIFASADPDRGDENETLGPRAARQRSMKFNDGVRSATR